MNLRPLAFVLLAGLPALAQTPLWLRYPALSPDGKTIAFCYQGDLYRVSAAGGTAVPLTVSEAHEMMPVWSPDGKSIAFASDRYGNFDVFIMPAEGGEARRLTFNSSRDLPTGFTPDGREVLFNAPRMDPASSVRFPARFPQLYAVSVTGGAARMVDPTPMEAAVMDASGKHILYQDLKGFENAWRKHHTSSVTRDLWSFDVATGRHHQLTTDPAEDRNPIYGPDGTSYFFLSERGGTSNVYRGRLDKPGEATPLTHFEKHPVRFLSAAQDGTLCFAWDGELYTQAPGAAPKKVAIRIGVDGRAQVERILPVNGGMTEFVPSPNGKEVAFVFRGEVFVASLDGGHTRRITDTPGQERSLSFSPDGRTLLYAAERNGSWDLVTTRITRPEEKVFYAATVLEEKVVLGTPADEFQPLFSPDGKEVAYLEERTALKVLNLASGKTRTLLPAGKSYSYSDGDQDFAWSPDSKWITLSFNTGLGWIRDVGILAADGSGKLVNLSRSGYFDGNPRFSPDGSMVMWTTDRQGLRNAAQQAATHDVYAAFLTQEAWDRYRLDKEEFALLKEQEEKDKPKSGDKEKKDDKKDEPKDKTLRIDWEGLEDRTVRLTAQAAELGDALLSKAGDKLFTLNRFDKGYDLWSVDLRTREMKLLTKLETRPGNNPVGLERSSDGKSLLVMTDGKLSKVDPESGKRDPIAVNGELVLKAAEERAYIFEHAWRQAGKKFYVENLHGVDWPFYVAAYRKFLPHVSNNYDFAELLSELLGELNASHTGGRYAPPQDGKDATASLGLFLEPAPQGLKVAEVLKKGPVDMAGSKVRPGHILTAIDGVALSGAGDPAALLNRKAGKPTLLTFTDPKEGTRWEQSVKPLNAAQENELLYTRWVDRSREAVERLSGGRLGYVHVRAMNDPSMRTVIDEVLGRQGKKEALVVDTRFNGGGNIHEQLSDFLSGKKYFDVVPRGQAYGHEPLMKWIKPSIVVMGESNYSDAHLFPVAYKLKGLGRTVGMPVPGTGTFVWWETQIDPTMVFGIPQGGWITPDGKYCENTQLEPDLRVPIAPEDMAAGRDTQLEAAVKSLLSELGTH
ncbi:MAG TPA: S41 family peptidase [Holophagaceae bacterium]|nr:S41 family peptidase [Holophagaceae bacterium]HJW34729.1 S41 family peptidase [Holophagaceae bacterium]